MRLLLVNSRYYLSGGPEKYLFALRDELRRRRVPTYVLSVATEGALPSDSSVHLIPSTTPGGKVLYDDYRDHLTLRHAFLTAARLIFSPAAYRATKLAITRWKIDVVYGLFLTSISPAPLLAAIHAKVPAFYRLSDYGLICARDGAYRNNRVCLDCMDSQWPALRYRCVRGSLPHTLIRVLAMQVHRRLRVYGKLDGIITPSRSLADTVRKSGLTSAPIHTIKSFSTHAPPPAPYNRDRFYRLLYVGRLSWDKGVKTLLEAFSHFRSDCHLIIAGSGPSQFVQQLKALVPDNSKCTFLGHVSRQQLDTLYQSAGFVIVPSVVPENGPNVLIEAQTAGVPAIVSNRPGLLEYSCPDATLTFQAGNIRSLLETLQVASRMSLSEWHYRGRSARAWALRQFNRDHHIQRLLDLFSQALS